MLDDGGELRWALYMLHLLATVHGDWPAAHLVKGRDGKRGQREAEQSRSLGHGREIEGEVFSERLVHTAARHGAAPRLEGVTERGSVVVRLLERLGGGPPWRGQAWRWILWQTF